MRWFWCMCLIGLAISCADGGGKRSAPIGAASNLENFDIDVKNDPAVLLTFALILGD